MPEDMIYPHITLNPRGVPCLDGTRHRVIDVVADHVAHGYSAAQIIEQYPDLTPAQVYAALTYYYDHQDALDAALAASYAQAEHQRQRAARHIPSWWRHRRDRQGDAAAVHGCARQGVP
jgi:uncharacterized protein (DUF433 family)